MAEDNQKKLDSSSGPDASEQKDKHNTSSVLMREKCPCIEAGGHHPNRGSMSHRFIPLSCGDKDKIIKELEEQLIMARQDRDAALDDLHWNKQLYYNALDFIDDLEEAKGVCEDRLNELAVVRANNCSSCKAQS